MLYIYITNIRPKNIFCQKRLHLLLPCPAYCSGGLPLIQVSFTKSNPSGIWVLTDFEMNKNPVENFHIDLNWMQQTTFAKASAGPNLCTSDFCSERCAAYVTRSTWGCSAPSACRRSTGSSPSPGRTWSPPSSPSPSSAPPSPSPTSSTSPASTGCSSRAFTSSFR